MLPPLVPDSVLRVIVGSWMASLSAKDLRRMRRHVEARATAPNVMTLGEKAEDLQMAVILLTAAEREAQR